MHCELRAELVLSFLTRTSELAGLTLPGDVP